MQDGMPRAERQGQDQDNMPEVRASVREEDMMFGYVTADIANMSKEEKACYKAHYCGLCHVLKERYGTAGTSLLSYDMTFLEMLLSDLNDAE